MYETAHGRDLKSSYDWLAFAAGLPAHLVPYTNQSASFQAFKGRCIIQGSYTYNGNAAGQAILFNDGEDATGPIFHQNFINNGNAEVRSFGTRGIVCETGVFVQLFGGPWRITLFVVPLWHYDNTPPGS